MRLIDADVLMTDVRNTAGLNRAIEIVKGGGIDGD